MRLIFLMSLLLFVGCAHPKKTSSFKVADVSPNKGVVYLYRLPTHVHSLNPDIPKFYAGDETVGKLLIGGYYAIELPPGEIDLTYKTPLFGIYFPWKSGRLKVKVKSSQPTFVKFEVTFGMGASTKFVVIPNHIGSKEITQTKLLKN